MTGGLVQLMATGVENLYLTDSPDITYWRSVHKRHTNFAVEAIVQQFNSKPTFGTRATCTISKQGDLVSHTYLVVELPALPRLPEPFKARYVDNIGCALVKAVELEIGGVVVDRTPGDFMQIWHELTKNNNARGLARMLGDCEPLTAFSTEKSSYTLYIPLLFWFCRHTSLSLPIIALEHSDVKINVEFNTIENCIVVGPSHYIDIVEDVVNFEQGEIVSQSGAVSKFMHFDEIANRLFYLKCQSKAFTGGELRGATGYSVTAKAGAVESKAIDIPSLFNSSLNVALNKAYLLVDMVYLDVQERLSFARSDHDILFDYLQFDNDRIVVNNYNKLKIGYSSLARELIVRGQLDTLAQGPCKDLFNYCASVQRTSSLIKSMRIFLGGNERENISGTYLYNLIQPFQHHRAAAPEGVMVYSFSLYPEQHQASGAINLSRIDDFTIELGMDPVVSYTNPAKVRVYAMCHNILRIKDGVSRLLFS